MSKHYQEQAKFRLAKSYFQTVLNQDPILPQHLKIAEEVALSLFGMGKQPDESGRAYFTRLAKKLEISLPGELRFEEERSSDSETPQYADLARHPMVRSQGR